VEIEGQRKLFTSCTTTVAPDMVVRTQNTSDQAHQAQVANLEFLLLNHPLDCPICDRGGECPLQDQALAFGPGESRYREAKRVYEKPLPLSPLVDLDRERCVLCARCTRFCDQISGDRFIELFARGAAEQVAIAAGEDFRSPFSGNTVQICPVGALTATPYRFVARPFDLSTVDTVCPHCSAGCNLKVDMRRGEVVRQLARDNLEVNDAWACDKGRFAFRFPDAPERVTTPLIRDRGLEPASFGEVFGRIAEWTKAGARVAFLAGGRLTDEDAYALSKLARTVFATNDLDHRRHLQGGDLELLSAAGLTGVTYDRVERASTIVLVGLDAEQEVPILHLRLRKAAARGASITVIHHRRTRLHDVAEHILCRPGEEVGILAELREAQGGGPAGRVGVALRDAGTAGVVLVGAGAMDRPGVADAALRAASATGARISLVSRRANDHGALRAGVHPVLLPGGRPLTVEEDRAEVEAVWGPMRNVEPGRDARGILQACARREIDVLFLVGVDPLRDVPDAALARHALENVPRKIVQSLELGSLEPFADAFLPAAAFVEKDGHFTTWEGRGQRLRRLRGAPGIALPDWEIFASLALACGGDLGFESLEELREELGGLVAPRESVPEVSQGAPATPAEDGLVLFTYPLLVDEGRLSERADELKAALEDEPFVEVHPDDAVAAGLVDGGRAVVRTAAGTAELPVRVTPHVAKGSVFVPFNQPGLAANTLLSGTFSSPVKLEAVATERAGTSAEEVPA
jgi:NADH-quinone oxidoreductase subunit G